MSSALRGLTLAGMILLFASAAVAVEVRGVDGEASFTEQPVFNVEKQVMKIGDREYDWADLIDVKLRPQQDFPNKGYKIFLRNGYVFYGEIVGASVEGASLIVKIKSPFLGGEAVNMSTDGIAGIQNLNLKVYMELALAALMHKAEGAPFGRTDFHGNPMTVKELQELYEQDPDEFTTDAEKHLSLASSDFNRYMKDKKRWKFDFYYGVKGVKTEVFGLIDRIDDNLDILLKREGSGKEVSGNLRDIVGLGFRAVGGPAGFGEEPYVRILGVRGELVAGQITSEKNGILEIKTDLPGIALKVSMDDIAEMIFFNGSFVFLSDLAGDAEKVKAVEYGDICLPGTTSSESFPWQRDRSTTQGRPPLKLNGKTYRKGIGVHSHSELTFQIDGIYKRFRALVGIDDNVPMPGDITIEIFGDGKELLKRTTVKTGDKPFEVDVDVASVRELKIVVDFGEGGYHNDHCDIANAILAK